MKHREAPSRMRGPAGAGSVSSPWELGLLLAVAVAGSCVHTPGTGGSATDEAGVNAAALSWDTVAAQRRAPDTPTRSVRLTAVRASAHAGFERLEFDFEPALPAYRIDYQEGPARDCGTGEELALAGDAWLAVTFRGASAHDDAGRATITDRDQRPALRVIRELRLSCDFEGVIAWAVGVVRRPAFRALPQDDPPRLLLDLRTERPRAP